MHKCGCLDLSPTVIKYYINKMKYFYYYMKNNGTSSTNTFIVCG